MLGVLPVSQEVLLVRCWCFLLGLRNAVWLNRRSPDVGIGYLDGLVEDGARRSESCGLTG